MGKVVIGRPDLHAVTIIAPNYLSRALVLAETFLEYHAATCTVVIVADTLPDGLPEMPGVRFVVPETIGFTRTSLHRLALQYDVTELCTAIKPRALLSLLAEFDRVVYLDPDMALYGPLSPIEVALDRSPIALTPHYRTPPTTTLRPTEQTVMNAGTFNLGFIAVTREARDFLSWWDKRLMSDCVMSIVESLFVDQRWINLAVGYWDVAICRHPGVNLAYWNLDEAKIIRLETGVTVDDCPLLLFHFSGLPPSGDGRWTTHVKGAQRQPVNDESAETLRGLFDEYHGKLARFAPVAEPAASNAYMFNSTASGRVLRSSERRFARHYMRTRGGVEGAVQLPDPFEDPTYDIWLKRRRLDKVRFDVRTIVGGLHKAFPGIEARLSRAGLAPRIRKTIDRGNSR
jgi:hypothetical protein